MENRDLDPLRRIINTYGYATTFEKLDLDTLDEITKGLVAIRTGTILRWGRAPKALFLYDPARGKAQIHSGYNLGGIITQGWQIIAYVPGIDAQGIGIIYRSFAKPLDI